MRKENTKLGFTLLEIMTVIAIIGIMTSVALLTLNPDRGYFKVEAVARELSTDIRALHRSALNGTVPSDVTGPVCGHGWFLDQNNATYQHFVVTKTQAGGDCTLAIRIKKDEQVYETTNIESGVSVATSGNKNNIYFEVPNGKVYADDNELTSGPILITAMSTESSDAKSVCIYPSGEVKEAEGNSCP